MKIGILQTGHAPDEARARLGDYDAMFHRLLVGMGLRLKPLTWWMASSPLAPRTQRRG